MHPERVLSTKLNNSRADGHCYTVALLGFNDLGRSVTPTFLFRNRFYIQLSPHYPKMNKKSIWEVKKNSRFLCTGHGILRSGGSKGRETMVVECKLVLWRTSPVDWIHLIGPLKPSLAETISLQFKALIAMFWDLQPLWPSLLTKPDLLRFRCSSGHVLSKTKSVTPHFFTFLTSLNHYLSMVKFS